MSTTNPDPIPAAVLVVDDDPAFGRMIAETLEDKGHRALWVASGKEALRCASVGRYAAAVVDLVMPHMGGLELVRRLKETSPDTEVVVLTGEADVESAVESLHCGVLDYLQKGELNVKKLERAIRAAVGKSLLARQNRELTQRMQESGDLLHRLSAGSVTPSVEADAESLSR